MSAEADPRRSSTDKLAQHRREINKRLTLNLLIQGAATHTMFTSHYLVRDELDAVDHRLLSLHDKAGPALLLQYWIGDMWMVLGRSGPFWRGVGKADHPFHHHPLLAAHGRALAQASRRHTEKRAREKGVSTIPGVHYVQSIALYLRGQHREKPHAEELVELAKLATHRAWGIDLDRLDGRLTTDVAFGNLRTPRTTAGKVLRSAVVGYGGVLRQPDGSLDVVARATVWPLLSHELTKGTAELVCLHGLRHLAPDVYEAAIDEADQLEYEVWLMQAGAELWRRFLAAIPPGQPLAETLMEVARLTPERLERLVMLVAEEAPAARQQIESL